MSLLLLFAGGAAPPGATGQVKHWTGSVWTAKAVKYYTGTEWVTKPLKYWTGTQWATTPY